MKRSLNTNNDNDESSSSKIAKKEKCKYGDKCYRKNALHLEMFQHPDNHVQLAHTNEEIHSTNGSIIDSRLSDNRNRIDDIYLSKVANVKSKFRELSLSDILSDPCGVLLKSAQFNFMFDYQWIISQYPVKFRSCPLLLVYGDMVNEADICGPNVTGCKADLPFQFGTHHTKMMLLHYDVGIRVVIHTANLIPEDWNHKTQCIWMSDIFPPIETNNNSDRDSPTHFKRDLIEYLSRYRKNPISEWISVIKSHDFSSCKVFLISSVPGQHSGNDHYKFGHLKLRDVLQKNLNNDDLMTNDELVAQFSSIGSLGLSKETWLLGEFHLSLSSCANNKITTNGSERNNLNLIYPCVEDVKNSLDGYCSGSSLPYMNSVHSKQFWIRPFFRKWNAKISKRSCVIPHMKSYLRYSSDTSFIHWYMLTSANLSKAAWGNLVKKNCQLFIRSYEIGVLFLPSQYNTSRFSTVDNLIESTTYIPIPYDLPTTKYDDKDEPWIIDREYKEPDICGVTWFH